MKKLFGTAIEPSCDYCSHNIGLESIPVCALSKDVDEECSHFSYDPLLRKPRTLPPMMQFSAEDFEL